MKLNASTRASLKVVAAALLISAGVFFGYRAWGDVALHDYHPTPINPGKVTLVGIETYGHYRVLVANEVAQLAEVSNTGAGRSSSMEGDATNVSRIPIREFLASLGGDEKALSYLVMKMNKMSEDDLPPVRVEWTAADIDKAIKGDPVLRPKLESDLHISLDGTPPPTLRLNTLLNGIVIDLPVKVHVPVLGKDTVLTATVQEPFESRFAQAVEKQINGKFNPPMQMITGWYRDAALPLLNGQQAKEDVAASLMSRISPERQKELAEKPESLLQGARVLLNDDQVKGAETKTYEGPNNQEFAQMTIHLTEDGRMRLWKYSHGRQEFHLMFVVNDVPLAAPRIETELTSTEVVLKQLPNPELAQGAADFINSENKKG